MERSEYVTKASKLPDRFSARLTREHIIGLRLLAEGGDWEELVHDTIVTLARDGATLTPEEKRDLRDLGQVSGLSDEVLGFLSDHS